MRALMTEDAKRIIESSKSPWMLVSFKHFSMGD
jgi:hypothetical protein